MDFESESHKFFSFFCPLTYDVMSEPVMAADNITYEKEAILEWFKLLTEMNRPLISPITNLPITEAVQPNLALKAALSELRAFHDKDSTQSFAINNSNMRAAFLSANLDIIPEISGQNIITS